MLINTQFALEGTQQRT